MKFIEFSSHVNAQICTITIITDRTNWEGGTRAKTVILVLTIIRAYLNYNTAFSVQRSLWPYVSLWFSSKQSLSFCFISFGSGRYYLCKFLVFFWLIPFLFHSIVVYDCLWMLQLTNVDHSTHSKISSTLTERFFSIVPKRIAGRRISSLTNLNVVPKRYCL